MKALIMKDVNLLGVLAHLGLSILIFFYAPVIVIVTEISTNEIAILTFTGISFFSLYIITSAMNKSNQDGDITLNSLPLEKEKIVLGRYLSLLMYSIIIPVYIYISYFFMDLNFVGVRNKRLSLLSILIVISILTIYNSISLLFYYKNENTSKKIEIVSGIIVLGALMLGLRYPEYFLDFKILQYLQSFNIILLLLLIFSIITYIASFKISKKMYKKKEF